MEQHWWLLMVNSTSIQEKLNYSRFCIQAQLHWHFTDMYFIFTDILCSENIFQINKMAGFLHLLLMKGHEKKTVTAPFFKALSNFLFCLILKQFVQFAHHIP